MRILVTGSAGFIGFHVVLQLLSRGDQVIGVDNLNDYYDPSLKYARLAEIEKSANAKNFSFHQIDIVDENLVNAIFSQQKIERVIHLAAQAGVRYSLINPHSYVQSNLVGFVNILEACRHYPVHHLVYASSSSVYGANEKKPFSESDQVDYPVSLYAATKKSNELIAYTYSHLYQIPTTGLRFFTVYGPWGRPDMSPFLFADAIINNKPIKVFNHGDMMRDFTYIDDIVEGVIRVLDKIATPESGKTVPYRIFNIGNHQPEQLMDFIGIMERAFGKVTQKEFMPMQPGDVKGTYADIRALKEWVEFKPNTTLEDGLFRFVQWYKMYYKKLD